MDWASILHPRKRRPMDWATITYPGTREVNEDSVGAAEAPNGWCFIAADGLGGHGMGDIASQLAVEAFRKTFTESEEPIRERLTAAFLQAQNDILREQNKVHAQMQMKTTATALVLTEDKFLWGHIGDTRLYAFARNRVKKRTLDHSIPQMLVHMREIKENEIRNHPDRNKLLRVLGVSGEIPRFELSEEGNRNKYQAFLICTDGFWELILEEEMEQCLKNAASAQEWLDQMAEIVRQRGEGTEMDNFSAVGVLV